MCPLCSTKAGFFELRRAMQVFAPLARLLGLYSIKEELEDLSFRFSEPENAARLAAQLATMRAAQAAGVCKARSMLQEALDGDPYLASCVERIDVEQQHKALYSIWRCARACTVPLHGARALIARKAVMLGTRASELELEDVWHDTSPIHCHL